MTKTAGILAAKKPLETLIALDAGFSCLLENIRNTQPVLAQSLAIDLQQTAEQIPLHLPPEGHGAADLLARWAVILKTAPSYADPAQRN